MGQNRVIIENVKPQINCGKYPAKRAPGEPVAVSADIYADGHDKLYAEMLWKHKKGRAWNRVKMRPEGNDCWKSAFVPEVSGAYFYTVVAGVDYLSTWYSDLIKKIKASQSVDNDLKAGAQLLRDLIPRATKKDSQKIETIIEQIERKNGLEWIQRPRTLQFLSNLLPKYHDDKYLTHYGKELKVEVSRSRASFSAWYERFPRSVPNKKGKHGTFLDCVDLLPEISQMGFNIFYLPPIHPIGITHRKGKNNQTTAKKNDPGSPWAIGSKEGGHDAIHPQLGTLKNYQTLISEAKKFGIEIAFDLAFQCSPDHPYIKEHPEWFLWQPDGTVRYAENPPKKYEDIVPFYFECEDWKHLWNELKRVVLFWCDVGVRIFRVDNPHTKPFIFWEWLIAEIKKAFPDVIFLAEAFTRPKVMRHLAKIGFDQSYTYFTWRHTKSEIEEYFLEVTQGDSSEYLRPNFWPNTPDILPQNLQNQERNAFIIRLILAATASSNYGIYGPCFENMVNIPLKEGSEEYLDSEKYEIKQWEKNTENLKELISLVNAIRKNNSALHYTRNFQIIPNDNPFIISFAKSDPAKDNTLIIVVNLDAKRTQSGWLSIQTDKLGIPCDLPYLVEDLLSGDKYFWEGDKAYVELDPNIISAHIFKVRKSLIKEQQFDYYL